MSKKSWWAFIRMQISLFCLLTLISCGKGHNEEVALQYEVAAGRYWTTLTPLNSKLGRSYGTANFSNSDNQFWARVKVFGPDTKSMHAQYIHVNGKCPTMRDDVNRDGYLDFMEAYRVVGPILIPLDSNLNSQQKGLNDFPKTMMKNPFYYYSEACNSSRMLEDLKQRDLYENDFISKLAPNEGINFTKRVLIIYGTNDGRVLPSTVRSFDGYPAQATIPIACGEIIEGESDDFSL